MGIRAWLEAASDPGIVAARTIDTPQTTALGAAALAFAGITSTAAWSPVTRREALSWPALNNGVRVLTTLTQQLPLKAESPNGVSADTDTFLTTLDPAMPPGWTLAKTVESLIFHQVGYWWVRERYLTGFPRHVEYVDAELVAERKDQTTRRIEYRVDGNPVSPNDVIKFDGVLPGLLTVGNQSIRTALANINAARAYAENPAPHMYLTDSDGVEPLEADDAIAYLQALKDAVTANGSAYLAGLQINQVGWTAREVQLVEARNQDAVEAARLLAMPTHYVAAPAQGSSLTYANLGEVRHDLIEGSLSGFATPIAQRLSMPDVTPRGTKVIFDAASFYEAVTPLPQQNNPNPTPAPDPQPDPAEQDADV